MWEEIQELLLGLLGALIALAAIYAFYAAAHGQAAKARPSRRAETGPDADREPDPAVLAERHEPLASDPEGEGAPRRVALSARVAPRVGKIFVSDAAAAAMRQVPEVEVVAGRGLRGDRYFLGLGHWSESDQHEVTLIMQEDLQAISDASGLSVQAGEHRRNLVTRGIDLRGLAGKRFRIGSAYFSSARPRPPCLYLQRITEPGMAKALVGRGGIGVRCFQSGTLHENDSIEVLDLSLRRVLARLWSGRPGP